MTGGSPHGAIELGSPALDELRQRGLPVPPYDRSRLEPRIVHIGVGGFHRAHLAIYCDDLAHSGSHWGICGIGLLPADRAMADALAPQDHLYTFTTKRDGERSSRVVGSIIDYVLADADHEPAAARIAASTTAIVSLTVTEAGYEDTERNRPTFAVIADGLDRRRRNGAGGVTIMSCDNVQGNGDVARRAVLRACAGAGRDLAAWVDAECTFPSSMVDRITPVTAASDRQYLIDRFGLVDRWPVAGEPFHQWVLEDDFAAGRPDFASVGALYTDDVHAWELYKLRLLNAGHSSIAYLSALAGVTFVDEALGVPELAAFLERILHREAVPTLDPIPGHPREEYADTVIERFGNSGVRDQIARLCIDGTSKFPTFVMPTIAGQLARGGPIDCASHALAGWSHYLADTPIDQQAHDSAGDAARVRALAARDEPTAFLVDNPAVPALVAEHPRFRRAFGDAHRSISGHGPLGALALLDHG